MKNFDQNILERLSSSAEDNRHGKEKHANMGPKQETLSSQQVDLLSRNLML